jgi:hypothetical protein
MKSVAIQYAVGAVVILALLGVTRNAAAEDLGILNGNFVTSSHWAGYAVQPSSPVSSVQGTWVVPTIDSTATPDGYSSIWVGIDGYANGTVEQIGIAAYGSAAAQKLGLPQYYAWYQFYPDNAHMLALTVNPGDTIHAEVSYSGPDKFSLLIQNLTTPDSYSADKTVAGMQRASAEWIVEAPYLNGTLPLADFGSVTFTGASATADGGQSSAISSFPFTQINLVPASGWGASTSDLDFTGTSFTVTAVPEPSTLVLLAIGGVNVLAYATRRRRP